MPSQQAASHEELLRQTQQLAPLLEISPSATVISDLDARVVAWNPAAEALFGYGADEAIGRNLDDLVATTDDLHESAVAYGRRAVRKEQVHTVTRRTRKDGSLVDVELLAAPLLVDETPVGTFGIYHDVTELQRQKQYYESLLETSPAAIMTVDVEGTVTSWNPAAERLLGYSREEATGRKIDELVANRTDLRDEAEDVSRRAGLGGQVHLVTRRTRKDGSLIDVDVVASAIFVAGEQVGYYAIYSDVSQLQRQKQYYASLFELSPTAIATIDPDDTVTSWNAAAERLFGYSHEEVIGRNIDDLIASTDDLRSEGVELARQAQRGEIHRVTRRMRQDGSLVDVDLRAAPIVVGGETVGMFYLYHDISELQRQKLHYAALVELSPTAIATVDRDDGVTSWNAAAEQLFGYAREEAIGRNINELVANSEEIHAEAADISRRATAGPVRLITRRTRKDGSVVDVEVRTAPLIVGGDRIGLLALYHDISELQRQKRYYESVFELSPTAIVTADNGDNVTSWNPAAEQLFGYTREEAIGRNADDLVAKSDELHAEAVDVSRRATAGPVRLVTRRTRKDGSLVDVEVRWAPLVVGGERIGLFGLYHDITELQRARREAEAATEAKSAFLATMSHEIRTPLNAVVGMTGLLLDTPLSAEQRSYTEVVRLSSDALLSVINEILDFSKIEAGRLILELQPFDLRQCVESALELVSASASEKGLDIAYTLDPEAPVAIIGDVTRLRQILLNLLNNAVKFTDHGEVVLAVDTEEVARGDGQPARHRIDFAVRDTGIGIPPDRMDRLFESFSQLDASTTRRHGGTGLGLAISRRLAELMGGTISAESGAGVGSTFRFTILADEAPGPTPAYGRGAQALLAGRRVLIVDDNATNREILIRQTAWWGMSPRAAASGAEALAWVSAGEPFDLGILDMQMPEMDGLALAREIRRHRPALELPLVMLSSIGRRGQRDGEAVFAAELTKPVKPSQLYDALMEVFGGRAAAQVPSAAPETASQLAEEIPLRILVAEDNAVNQRLALLLLEKLGYRADVAADGQEAVDALQRQPYDVVLMDVHMPEMDGLQATRLIRQRSPEPDRPRIIAMTASALQGDREACLAAGMDDYISKPIHQEELAAALARSRVATNNPVHADGQDEGRTDAVDLDRAALDQLSRTAGGSERLPMLIGIFLEDTAKVQAGLRHAVGRGDAPEVHRLAHSLKSTAASFGAITLSVLSRRLEALSKAGSVEGSATLVSEIEAEFARVREALSDIAATRPT